MVPAEDRFAADIRTHHVGPSVRHIEGAVCIGYQCQAISPFDLVSELQQTGIEVFAIRDHFGREFVEQQRRFQHAPLHRIHLKLTQLAFIRHGTKHMVHMSHSPANRFPHLRERSPRMPNVGSHAPIAASEGELFRPGDFGSDRRGDQIIGEL
jgi:hypothetical protein